MENLELVTLTPDNLEDEHICCAFSDKKSVEGYNLKKSWLRERITEGFVFKKFDVRGKVFIEYTPAEYAWHPIDAPGYMCIHCFWVSGKYKGQGLGKRLLEECINDSQDMNGIVVVSSKGKKPFLTDKSFFVKYGFEVCDTAPPYFELLAKRFNPDAPLPQFRPNAKTGTCYHQEGLVVYYTDQCPYTNFYVDEMLAVAAEREIPAYKIRLTTIEDVQNAPSPFGTFGVYYNGEFVTHEILSRKRLIKILDKIMG
ncbi:MAG: GNAT family N-acetyltransferase [Anaerolineae bacterium]|nr:GNAT family N-acetyltransferase [Anaerolineae bacterium]